MPEDDRFIYSLKEKKLNLMKMQEAAKIFVGEFDFSAFSASRGEDDRGESKVRKVTEVKVTEVGEEIQFDVEGRGFLYKMVRSMVGALLDVGAEKLQASDILNILESRKRTERVVSAPAKGLCLEKVYYQLPGES
jgi:tRNA pseudouridine38-40 synthase